jgi:hypothetical protein
VIGFLPNLYCYWSISLSIFYKLSSHPLTQDSSMKRAGVMSINWERFGNGGYREAGQGRGAAALKSLKRIMKKYGSSSLTGFAPISRR